MTDPCIHQSTHLVMNQGVRTRMCQVCAAAWPEPASQPDAKDQSIAELAALLTTPIPAFGNMSALAFLRSGNEASEHYVAGTLRRMFGGATEQGDQLRARVQELERENRLYAVDQVGRIAAEMERDEARAECQRLKADIVDVYERCEHLEAQAARMREALHSACNAIQNGQPELAAKDLDDALAETDAGALGLKLVEALRKCRDRIEADDCWRADNGEVQHNDLCVIATDALDAWTRCDRGRDGDG